MKVQKKEQDIAVWFVRAAVVCSMLAVWNIEIGGIAFGLVILFAFALVWMTVNIVRINRGQIRLRQKYAGLDIAMIFLLLYEMLQLVVTLISAAEGEVPDYSRNLLLMGLVMLYLLMMETGDFERMYLDLILYGALVVMTVMLLAYLCSPRIGECLIFWNDQGEAASYLLLAATVSTLQYCTCNVRMQSCFYAMCALISFFLLGCRHSIISFWILGITILLIPILLRPTALVWKRAMHMLFLFMFLISNMSLVTNYTGLLLTETSYDLEHSVYLDLLLAIGGVVYFHYWDRIPEKVRLDRIVLRRLYRLDKYLLKACFLILLTAALGGAAWESLDRERMGIKAFQGFVLPLIKELEQNRSFYYQCAARQGILGAVLCIAVIILAAERAARFFGWDKTMSGVLCAALSGVLMQLLVWEGCVSILALSVILLAGAVKGGEKKSYTGRLSQRGDMKRMKKNKKNLSVLLLSAGILLGCSMAMQAQAQEEIAQMGQIMTTRQELDMKADPDVSAKTLHTYGEGDNVFVTGETASGWYQVRYQDLTGYIPADSVTAAALDMETLDQQFAAEAEEGRMLVEEVERQRDEAKRSKIWGTIIVVLVAAIFATGIVSTMKSGKRGEERA